MALAVFDWMDSRPEYQTRDHVLYTRLLSIFARQRDGLGRAMSMFDRMIAAGIQPDIVAFNAAIRAAGNVTQTLPSCATRPNFHRKVALAKEASTGPVG